MEAIENLNDKNIIIKEAEKGNAIVVRDWDYYNRLCLSILENELKFENTPITNLKIKKYYDQIE